MRKSLLIDCYPLCVNLGKDAKFTGWQSVMCRVIANLRHKATPSRLQPFLEASSTGYMSKTLHIECAIHITARRNDATLYKLLLDVSLVDAVASSVAVHPHEQQI